MRSSSDWDFKGDFALPVPILRNSSKDGIAFGGVRGIVGLSMDRIWKGAGDWSVD